MPFVFGRLYSRLGKGYFLAYGLFELVSAFLVCLATVGLFSLYEPMAAEQWWEVLLVAEGLTLLALVIVLVRAAGMTRPIAAWLCAGKPAGEPATEAWRAAVSLPRRLAIGAWQPFLVLALPFSIYFTVAFGLPAYSALAIFAGACVSIAYAAILHFFASELFLRPAVVDIVERLPPDFSAAPIGVPLRWKLLGALPLINVVTGVVVSGLSTNGSASLNDLGIDVVVAVLVAFTISLELTVLLTKSVLRPVEDLLRATHAVKRGDLEARVPVVSGDEMGELAGSFNAMMRGLSERETLRAAFGSYVDPEIAERVLEEGELLEGQEREVTIMIVDVRDFTPRAERSSARETVAFLNEFFDAVVPCLLEHGGHANKFLGDGVLAVFGAPERLSDHADRAVAAARAVVGAVEQRFNGEVKVGVGLNSGPVVVGSIGGGGRLEFSVIGDAVNVAARVEANTVHTGDVVLLTEATRCLLRDGRGIESRGEFQLKGVSDPVHLYALIRGLDKRSILPRPLMADA